MTLFRENPDSLARAWDRNGVGSELWADIQQLGDLFLKAAHPERLLRQHHLLLAVGNFKRDARIRPHPLETSPMPRPRSNRPRTVTFESREGPFTVRRDEKSTWHCASCTPGIGPATGTTLLAAIWPRQHAIMDRLAVSAAIGLSLARKGAAIPLEQARIDPGGSHALPSVSWDWYPWYKNLLEMEAKHHDSELIAVERSLYELHRLANKQGAFSRSTTWLAYGKALSDLEAELSSVAHDAEFR